MSDELTKLIEDIKSRAFEEGKAAGYSEGWARCSEKVVAALSSGSWSPPVVGTPGSAGAAGSNAGVGGAGGSTYMPAGGGGLLPEPASAAAVPAVPLTQGSLLKEGESNPLATIRDGEKTNPHPQWPSLEFYHNGVRFHNVDRFQVPENHWKHLPRIRVHLTYPEWNKIPEWYRGLYIADDHGYTMQSPFCKHWGFE